MKKNKDEVIVDKYLDMLVKTVIRLQVSPARDKWPLPKLHIWDCEIYISPYLLRALYNYFKESEAKGICETEIAKIYKYPDYFARIPLLLYIFRPISPLNEEEMKWLGYKIARILDLFYNGKYDSKLTRKNILWDDKTLKSKMVKVQFKDLNSPQNENIKKLISQIKGKLYLYSELLFNDCPNFAYEFHGPYKWGDKSLLVREYHNLKFEFWTFSQKFPYKKIVIYELFDNAKIKIGIDMHGRLYTDNALSTTLGSYMIYVDGEYLDTVSKLEKISKTLSIYLQKGASEKSKLSKKSIIKSFAYTRSLLIKPLAAALGKDWQPPKEIIAKIDKFGLSAKEKEFNKLLFTNVIDANARFDPRIKIAF